MNHLDLPFGRCLCDRFSRKLLLVSNSKPTGDVLRGEAIRAVDTIETGCTVASKKGSFQAHERTTTPIALDVDTHPSSDPIDSTNIEHRWILRQFQTTRPNNRDRSNRTYLDWRCSARERKRTSKSSCNGRCHLCGYRCCYGCFSANIFHMEPRRNGLYSITTDRRSYRRHSCQCNLGCSFGISGYWNHKGSNKITSIE
jgi:hypothetical protein